MRNDKDINKYLGLHDRKQLVASQGFRFKNKAKEKVAGLWKSAVNKARDSKKNAQENVITTKKSVDVFVEQQQTNFSDFIRPELDDAISKSNDKIRSWYSEEINALSENKVAVESSTLIRPEEKEIYYNAGDRHLKKINDKLVYMIGKNESNPGVFLIGSSIVKTLIKSRKAKIAEKKAEKIKIREENKYKKEAEEAKKLEIKNAEIARVRLENLVASRKKFAEQIAAIEEKKSEMEVEQAKVERQIIALNETLNPTLHPVAGEGGITRGK